MKPFLSILIPTYNRAEMTLEAVASVGKAVWDTVLYILRVTSTKPDKFDIFDMYLDAGLKLAFTKDRLDVIKQLANERNKK
jgi:hypothetical protein